MMLTKTMITKIIAVSLNLLFAFSRLNLARNQKPIITSFECSKKGKNITLKASASSSGAKSLVYDWDFGDGMKEQMTQLPTLHSIIAHAYRNKGIFDIVLRVKSDSDEAVIESSVVIE